MMRRQQSQDNFLEAQDEHNQPTEPMPHITPSPFSPGDNAQIPVPQPYERPFPGQEGGNKNTISGVDNRPPGASSYPYLPPTPGMRMPGRPPGGSTSAWPGGSAIPVQARTRHSPLPIFVGMFFITIQLLLLARFVLKIIRWPGSTTWVGLIYSVSNVFVLPFRLLLQNIALPAIFLSTIEISTLLAILVYWLLSRILVHLLKAILYSS
jgi:hypothetical protein